MSTIRDDLIKTAYRKLKSHIYYDNSNIFLKAKIAEFEKLNAGEKLNDVLMAKFKRLEKDIEDYTKGNTANIDELLKSINYRILPKKFKNFKTPEGIFFFKGSNNSNVNIAEKYNIFIDCPIELHIIDVIWIMKIGEKVDRRLDSSCYANRLFRNIDEDSGATEFNENKIRLFRNYKEAYPKWRDEAIKKAKALHAEELDVCFVNLDIKEYFYSIDFDFSLLNDFFKAAENEEDKPSPEYEFLSAIVSKIHSSFREKCLAEDQYYAETYKGRKFLPISLLSSGILANLYLNKYDKKIISEVKPAFYGRYVDDIIFVLCNPKIDTKKSDIIEADIYKVLDALGIVKCNDEKANQDEPIEHKILKKYFNSHGLPDGSKTNGVELRFKDADFKNLQLQSTKVKVYYFDKYDSIAILKEFETIIQKNASEFNHQADEDDIFTNIENPFFKIDYSDTINKLRSIEKQSTDKLKASKYLTKLIRLSSIVHIDEEKKKEIHGLIRDFFDGQTLLELFTLWEKIFTYYFTIEANKQILSFAKRILSRINKLELDTGNTKYSTKMKSKIRDDLRDYLVVSIAMSMALKMRFYSKLEEYHRGTHKGAEIEHSITELLLKSHEESVSILNSNMLRHHFVSFPLLNYIQLTKTDGSIKYIDLVDKNFYHNDSQGEFELDTHKHDFSPRFIHFHEFAMFNLLKDLQKNQSNDGFLEKAIEEYEEKNKLEKEKKVSSVIKCEKTKDEKKPIKIINPDVEKKNLYKVGLVNIAIEEDNILKSINCMPNLSIERLFRINKALNIARKDKCDLLIFPEVSIQFVWLNELVQFAKKNNIAIVCGLEHINVGNAHEIYNFVCTILPFKHNYHQNAVVDFRLKKDYSPEEKRIIEGRKYTIPEAWQKNPLRIYNWNNLLFSVFNCYELTDIKKRAMFIGELDLMIGVEYNRDTHYFSNIADSTARDLHVFFAQVNSSNFGDSRITKPSKKDAMDIVKIKGGENISVQVGTIDIKSLREHQKLSYELQKDNDSYKPTPPDFTMSGDRGGKCHKN